MAPRLWAARGFVGFPRKLLHIAVPAGHVGAVLSHLLESMADPPLTRMSHKAPPKLAMLTKLE